MTDPSVTERSYPFATGQGASVTEDDWSAMVNTWQDKGVVGSPATTGLTVVPGPTQNTIQINIGQATIDGFTYRLTAPKILATTTNPGGSARSDLVHLRHESGVILPYIRTASTVASLTASEIPLAYWSQLPDSTATSSLWGSATDMRWFTGQRMRPALTGSVPPATVGGFMYQPTVGVPDTVYLGGLVGGVPQWKPWTPQVNGLPVPRSWSAFGHSYMSLAGGANFTSGRLDVMFRNMVGINPSDFKNHAVWGSALNQDSRKPGGWTRVMQEITRPVAFNSNIHAGPYFPEGGAYLYCYGINDIGFTPTATQAQIRATLQNTLRAVICRSRTSVIWEDNYVPASGTVGQPVYGAGFVQTTGTAEFSSGTTLRDATATTNATVTLTLPSDYAGEPVVIQFIANAGVTNGTVTFTGTAGVTGTFAVANALSNVKVPVVKRITSLTSANAGQTIIMSATQIDAGGSVRFDYWGLESKTPVPVIICNVNRILPAGYAGYSNTIGDADVTALNSAFASVVAEFDGLVRIADLDSAINKDTSMFVPDGLHFNEVGAARAAGAVLSAVRSLTPSDLAYPYANTTSSPLSPGLVIPRTQGNYYTAEYATTTAASTFAAGDVYAIPFVVTEGRGAYIRPSLQVAGTTPTTAGSARFAIYDDVAWKGYPQALVQESTSAGAFALSASLGLKANTGSTFLLDQALYWLIVKLETIGTSMQFVSISGPDGIGVMPKLGATYTPGVAGTMTVNTTPIAWKLTGQAAGALPNLFPTTASVAAIAPMVALMKG